MNFAQAILYLGAGFAIVWRSFVIVAGIVLVFFIAALVRFPANRGGELEV